MAQNVTAAQVSRILAKVHTRSTSHASRVRGMPIQGRGFTAQQFAPNAVRVEYEKGSYVYRSGDVAETERNLTRYAQTLALAGYAAEIVAPYGPGADARYLLVTKEA
jgi:hypothetical protein